MDEKPSSILPPIKSWLTEKGLRHKVLQKTYNLTVEVAVVNVKIVSATFPNAWKSGWLLGSRKYDPLDNIYIYIYTYHIYTQQPQVPTIFGILDSNFHPRLADTSQKS